MNLRQMEELDTRIRTIRKAAQDLAELASEFPAVDRNVRRILASVKMLELNVSDLLPHLSPEGK